MSQEEQTIEHLWTAFIGFVSAKKNTRGQDFIRVMNLSNFVCTDSDFPPAGPGANQPDPNLFAPLLVGDWVSFEAVNVGGDLWAAYSLDANLGLYTAAGKSPVYITIDVAQWGIVGSRDGEVAETRVHTIPRRNTKQMLTVTDPRIHHR